MTRPVLIVLMAVAVIFTAMLAYTMLGDDGSGSRGGRTVTEDDAGRPDRGAPAEGPADRPGKEGKPTSVTVFLVTGTVRDIAGRAVEGATVLGSGAKAVTDSSGGYRLMSKSAFIAFDVYAMGYLPIEGTLNGQPVREKVFVCEGGGPWRKDFTLRPAATLRGRLFDPDRRPVADARVYVLSPDRALLEDVTIGNVVSSDKEGWFRFPGLPAGKYDLGVRAVGFLPQLRKDVVVGESGVVEEVFSLRRGRTVTVRVNNKTEATRVFAADSALRKRLLPPGGAEVLMDALVGREYVDFPVVGGRREQGLFVLRGVAAKEADVTARDPERITEPGLGEVLDTIEPRLELTLVTATEIEIRVYDENTRESLNPAIHRETDGKRRRIPVEYVGGAAKVPADRRAHTLVFSLQGYEESRYVLPAFGTAWPEFIEVTMRPRADGAETGQFTIEFDKPIAKRVALVGRDADGRVVWTKHLQQAAAKNKWPVEKVPYGEYQVSVLATGQVPAIIPRVVVAKGLHERHPVRLVEGGGIELKVTDRDGKLLDKVGFALRNDIGVQIDVHVMMYLSDRRAFVSVNSLPLAATAKADSGLAPGAYTITAYRSGYEPTTKEFTVVGRQVATVTIVLPTR